MNAWRPFKQYRKAFRKLYNLLPIHFAQKTYRIGEIGDSFWKSQKSLRRTGEYSEARNLESNCRIKVKKGSFVSSSPVLWFGRGVFCRPYALQTPQRTPTVWVIETGVTVLDKISWEYWGWLSTRSLRTFVSRIRILWFGCIVFWGRLRRRPNRLADPLKTSVLLKVA